MSKVHSWMNTKDYTKFPLGTQSGLKIEECPHCHLPGRKIVSNGTTSYRHADGQGYTDEGEFAIGWDSCPKDRPPVRTGRPDDILD
jgi:hypothetical protein